MKPLPNPETAWPVPHRAVDDLKTMVESRIGRSPDSMEVLPGGHANLNIRLDRDRMLRVYERAPQALGKERTLLERAWGSFRVPEVLTHGDDFMVLEWIDLKPVLDTEASGEAVGRAASEIHGVSFERSGFLDGELRVVESLPSLREYLTSSFDQLDRSWSRLRVGLEERLTSMEDDLECWTPVLNHGDFKASNLFLDQEGRLVVLDWEFAFSGPDLMDLGQLFRWHPSAAFEEGFERGYERSGAALPEDWRERAEILDLVNLIGLAIGTDPGSTRGAHLRGRVEETLDGAHSRRGEAMSPREGVLIRAAQEREAELLTGLALRSKAVWGYSDEFLERCRPLLTVTAAYVRSHPVFVAEVEDSIAGFYSLRERGGDLELDLLFVEPRLIGRGVGQGLLEHAIRIAGEAGYARMIVESDPYAEPFYIRWGGRRIGTVGSTVEQGRLLPLLAFDLTGGGSEGHSGSAGA